MKFLIDNALSPLDIHARALDESRVVVSVDSDFGTILAETGALGPSFILFREPDLLTAHDYCRVLIPALGVLEPELLTGCVAVFRNGRLRIRKLPFPD